jgi:hypothetical protein
MVLVLSRGGYCPKDRRQAELLVQLYREIDVAYCRLVTISTTICLRQTNIAPVSAHTGRASGERYLGVFERSGYRFL